MYQRREAEQAFPPRGLRVGLCIHLNTPGHGGTAHCAQAAPCSPQGFFRAGQECACLATCLPNTSAPPLPECRLREPRHEGSLVSLSDPSTARCCVRPFDHSCHALHAPDSGVCMHALATRCLWWRSSLSVARCPPELARATPMGILWDWNRGAARDRRTHREPFLDNTHDREAARAPVESESRPGGERIDLLSLALHPPARVVIVIIVIRHFDRDRDSLGDLSCCSLARAGRTQAREPWQRRTLKAWSRPCRCVLYFFNPDRPRIS